MKSLLNLLIVQSLLLLFLLAGILFYVSSEDPVASTVISIEAATATDTIDTQISLPADNETQVKMSETSVAAEQNHIDVSSQPQRDTNTSTSQHDAVHNENPIDTKTINSMIGNGGEEVNVGIEHSKPVENSVDKVASTSEEPSYEPLNQTDFEPALVNPQDALKGISSPPSVEDKQLTSHTVVAGDSLWKIARAYRLSVSEIQLWNNLTEDAVLQIGQMIRIQSPDSEDIIRSKPITLETPVTHAEAVNHSESPVPVTPTKEWIVDIARFDAGKDFQALAAAGDLLRAGIDVQLYKTSSEEIRIFGKKVSSSNEAVDQLKLIRRTIKNRNINPTIVEFDPVDLGSLQPFNPSRQPKALIDIKIDPQSSEPTLTPEVTQGKALPKSTFFGFEVTPTEIDF